MESVEAPKSGDHDDVTAASHVTAACDVTAASHVTAACDKAAELPINSGEESKAESVGELS